MRAFYQKRGEKLIRNFSAAFLLGLCVFPFSAYADGFLSKIPFFQRSIESPDQKERTTKDLMNMAIDNVVFEASQVNGFYHEPDLKIEVSDQIKKIKDISKKLNVNLFWHDIEMGLNRAAEKAAPKAGVLMKNALKDLRFEKDPEKILSEEGSMTSYFQRKMEERVRNDFKREIERSVSGENSLASYVEMKNLYAALPFVNPDKVFVLENEISKQALDGIFLRIKEEESRLRSARSGS